MPLQVTNPSCTSRKPAAGVAPSIRNAPGHRRGRRASPSGDTRPSRNASGLPAGLVRVTPARGPEKTWRALIARSRTAASGVLWRPDRLQTNQRGPATKKTGESCCWACAPQHTRSAADFTESARQIGGARMLTEAISFFSSVRRCVGRCRCSMQGYRERGLWLDAIEGTNEPEHNDTPLLRGSGGVFCDRHRGCPSAATQGQPGRVKPSWGDPAVN